MSGPAEPVHMVADEAVSCASRLWTTRGELRATFIVKATFRLVPWTTMEIVAPDPVIVADRHYGDDPRRSLELSDDLAPALPRADVLFSGHAHAPPGHPVRAAVARVAVIGTSSLVDKTLHVFGDRVAPQPGVEPEAPAQFEAIPIVYERASRGPAGENCAGIAPYPGGPMPNVVDPTDPEAAAGFGPIAAEWPERSRLLRDLDLSAVRRRRLELPTVFAWPFFHAAPPDQRCAHLRGDEWVVLDGLHPSLPRYPSQLPGARARVLVGGLAGAMDPWTELELVADTLRIDGDRQVCSLTWRGNTIVHEQSLAHIVALAAIEVPGRPIEWPSISDVQTISEAPASPPPISVRAPVPPGSHRTLHGGWEEPTANPADSPSAVLVPGHAPEEDQAAAAERGRLAVVGRTFVLDKLAANEPLRGLDLRFADLAELDLEGRDFAGSDLQGAILRECRLVAADLTAAKLDETDMRLAVLVGATLARSTVRKALLDGASFDRADLSDADFSEAHGERTSFEEIRGARTIFSAGSWPGAVFERAELEHADFSRAELSEAHFENAELSRAVFEGANGPNATFNNAQLTGAVATAAHFEGATFADAFAPESTWEDAHLERASFRAATLHGALLTAASCDGTDFSECALANAHFDGAKLDGATFDHADLTGVTFEGASGAPSLSED